jgi:two-component system, NtrC family, response regulator AtoC
VLIVGPDDGDRRALHSILGRRGLTIVAVPTLAQAAEWLGAHACDLVIGDAAADALRGRGVPVLALGDDARGSAAEGLARLVGSGAAMELLRATIKRVAQHRSTVLITGESGTGKELVARAIHDESPRRERRFVAINCAAIPATLLESELFGHRKGAFTDAVKDRAGLFEEADGGTLFLDEIGELPMALQVKLLRAIQESEIRRIGDTASIKVDVRLIAATLRDLQAEVAGGRFREDLFYRLNVLPVVVPPLRDRADDVAELVATFASRHAERSGRTSRFTPEAVALLAQQPWPGNVRELENAVERALVLAEGDEVDAAFLADHVRRGATPPPVAPTAPVELSIKKATRDLEVELIKRALAETGGNRTNAAKLLEISHRALLYKIKEYGL